MTETREDKVFWLAINIYHEARGESLAGQIAVGHVVLNRCQKSKKTVKDIVLAPFQFSWHNCNKFPAIKDYDALQACFRAANGILEERGTGENLSGADHYFAEYITPPGWSKGMTKIAKIGKHIFYKA